jgi:hypothetical protein
MASYICLYALLLAICDSVAYSLSLSFSAVQLGKDDDEWAAYEHAPTADALS